jgi:hypothetical protein
MSCKRVNRGGAFLEHPIEMQIKPHVVCSNSYIKLLHLIKEQFSYDSQVGLACGNSMCISRPCGLVAR